MNNGQKIELLVDSEWVKAIVVDPLSVQFTAVLEDESDERVFYKFYGDKGTEWRET